MENIFRDVESEEKTTNNVVEKTKERMIWRQLIERAGKS